VAITGEVITADATMAGAGPIGDAGAVAAFI
jgi:hypothetical protein